MTVDEMRKRHVDQKQAQSAEVKEELKIIYKRPKWKTQEFMEWQARQKEKAKQT